MAKKLMLPENLLRVWVPIAKMRLELEGVSPKSDKYDLLLKKYTLELAREAVEDSITAKQNPQLNKTVSMEFPELFSERGKIVRSLGGEKSTAVVKEVLEPLSHCISTMSSIYMKAVVGLGKSSDFDIKKGMSESEMRQVIFNQYYRRVVQVVFLSLVEQAFMMDPDRLRSELQGVGLDNRGIMELNKPSSIMAFTKAVKEKVVSELRKISLF